MSLPSEDILLEAARVVSGARIESVFADFTRAATELLDCDIGLLGRYLEVAGVPSIETLACYANGRFVSNHTYPLDGTPCATAVGQEFRFYPQGVGFLFPEVAEEDARIEGYAAYPLFDREHRSLGIITVMRYGELHNPERVESLLRLFAQRAVAEIERSEAAAALRASEEQYRAIFNASMDGLVLLKLDGEIVDVNPAIERLYGYSQAELVGRNVLDVLAVNRREASIKFMQTVCAEGYAQTKDRATRKDGSEFACEPRAVLMDYRGETHMLAIVRDISERLSAEEKRQVLENQLRQAQKMEAIGHLTGGIAHDFNNILTSVLGYVELAAEKIIGGDERIVRYLDRARRSGERARDLVQQMLTFSRGQHGEPRSIDLGEVVREGLQLLESTLPATIRIETEFERGLPTVVADPVHVEQVLVNLCINARDAMDGHGALAMTLRRAEWVQGVCSSCQQPLAGDFVELAVRDSGPGMAAEIVERIFEPFFSTKEIGRGSGMGLATVHGIVHECGGHVRVDTAPGAGATFGILFPVAASSVPIAAGAAASARPQHRPVRGRVLVVDDNPTVAEFLDELLSDWGLTVTVATEPDRALACFEDMPQVWDLVLTDQTMPRITGLELARRMLQLAPALPIILYTGYAEGLTEQAACAAGIRALLRKPLDVPRLRLLVSEILAPAR